MALLLLLLLTLTLRRVAPRRTPLLYVNVNAAQNIIQKTLTHFCARVAHTHAHAYVQPSAHAYSERERDTRPGTVSTAIRCEEEVSLT